MEVILSTTIYPTINQGLMMTITKFVILVYD